MVDCRRRLSREVEKLCEADKAGTLPTGIVWAVGPDTLTEWLIWIRGSGVFEKYWFKARVTIGKEYPIRAPVCKFVIPPYHPNVGSSGDLCLDILSDKWSPSTTLVRLGLSLQLLMQAPNYEDPLRRSVLRPTSEVYEKEALEAMKHMPTAVEIPESWRAFNLSATRESASATSGGAAASAPDSSPT